MELQRQTLLMYTSCGWFFDELSGIETVQVIQYAGRAVQLAHELFGEDLEPAFLERLGRAKSNIPEHIDGSRIYEKFVRPAVVDLAKVAAHYAASSLFEYYGRDTEIYCYRIEQQDYRRVDSGRVRLAVGRVRVTSQVTWESAILAFACIHFGDHNLVGGVRGFGGEIPYMAMANELTNAIGMADLPQAIRRLDHHFGTASYSLKSLFRDEQRKILDTILEETLASAEGVYRQLYQQHAPLMRFVAELGVPMPNALRTAAQYVLNIDLRRALGEDEPDFNLFRSLLSESAMWQAELDTAGLRYTLGQFLTDQAQEIARKPKDLEELKRLDAAIGFARSMPFEVDLSEVQYTIYELLRRVYPDLKKRAESNGSDEDRQRVAQYTTLAEKLSIRVHE